MKLFGQYVGWKETTFWLLTFPLYILDVAFAVVATALASILFVILFFYDITVYDEHAPTPQELRRHINEFLDLAFNTSSLGLD